MTTETAIDTTTITIEVPNAQIVWLNDYEELLPEDRSITFEADLTSSIGCPLSELSVLYCGEFSEELDRVARVDDLLWDAKECQKNGERNQPEAAEVISWLAALRTAFPDLEVRIYTKAN